jgi:ACS family D-galactonate transporter-like MFS transporter
MPDTDRPTAIRWRIVALLMGYAALCHFNRVSMSVAGTERIIPQLGVSETTMGMVYSSYLLLYTLCMTPGGWLIDWAGPRRALILMGAGAAVFVSLTGVVGMFVPAGGLLAGLFLVRAMTGIANSPIHPGAARVVSFWIPPRLQSWANGLVTGAALLGIAATYPVFGALIDRFGWPTAFVFSGAATAVMALAWTLYARDRPALHPGTNEAERALIQAGRAPDPEVKPAPAAAGRWTDLLRNRSLMMLTVSYAAVGYVEYLFYYWMEHYFSTVLHLDTATSRSYSMITSLAMAAGMAGGGWLADRFEHRLGLRRGRPIVPVAGMLAGALLVTLGVTTHESTLVLLLFSLGTAAVGATEGPFWTTAIELGGNRGGTSAAIFNTGGNVGGLLAPVVTPLFSGYVGWQGSIVLAAVISVLGAVLWRWIVPVPTAETPASS